MSVLSQLSRAFRGPRNQRVARYGRRVARSGLPVSAGRADAGRPLRAIVWGALALVLFQIEAGLLPHLAWVQGGTTVLRVDFAVLIAVFCALELSTIEGALGAFAAGYVADLFVGGPPGLCRLLAVGVWIGVRLASGRVQLGPGPAAVVFTAGAAVAYQAGVVLGVQLASGAASGAGTIAWLSVVPQAVLTAAVAPLCFRLLRSIELRTAAEA